MDVERAVTEHYAHGTLEETILGALAAAGKDLNRFTPKDLAPVDEFPIDKWDAIIAINLSSAFHCIRASLPRMRAKGWGRIVMTASAHALNAVTSMSIQGHSGSELSISWSSSVLSTR